ncbi:hypothetical protein [Halalkalibacter akibai]|uniref:PilN domain-containing protein n=1 Tax=Halalkalibacter akibai (strain ATCC 43226 / DSM 21942 / CIP 109018 / JCM 9157 / 1139) TaxID=1236973 RepID=W4QUG0_HALA3|nr:hypothetical protein [Halalkalibacter akibai]GAE34949.1 hypothetical protein JCM9157_2034 [Halalkalibacter akibai JCM 9157]
MNISIDLLPQRTRSRTGNLPIIPVAGVLSIVAGAVVLTYTFLDTRSNVEALEAQVATQTELLTAVEADFLAMTTGINDYNYVDYFTSMDTLLTNVYKGTIPLKQRIYFHLPEEASVNSYSYVNNGDLSIQITSVSKGDAAVYLHHLLNEQEVSGAEVNTIALEGDEGVTYLSNYTLKLKTLVGEDQ